jgi:hypothetical protein
MTNVNNIIPLELTTESTSPQTNLTFQPREDGTAHVEGKASTSLAAAVAVLSLLAAEDQPASDATGMLDLYNGDHGLVGIDACLPAAVCASMLAVAVAEGLELPGLKLCQVDEGGPTSLQVEVPPDAVAALLAPAERAGVKIVDGRGVEQPA